MTHFLAHPTTQHTSSEGAIYFKADSPVDPNEPVLIQSLARWRPDVVPEPLAVDTKRGWLLMRDAGQMLRNTIRPTQDIRPWLPVLPIYTELQILSSSTGATAASRTRSIRCARCW